MKVGAFREFVAREIQAREKRIVGTVMSRKKWVLYDGSLTGGQSLVVDVDIGNRNVHLRNVPVKAGANGSRFYAGVGQSVELRSNAHGRYDVVGPASQVTQPTVVCVYDMATRSLVSTATEGFLFERVPFAFYLGPVRAKWLTSLETCEFTESPYTMVRSDGSWVADGFTNATEVIVGGTQNNDGAKGTPTNVAPLIMTFGSGIVTEAPVANAPVCVADDVIFANGTTTFNLILQTDAQGVLV